MLVHRVIKAILGKTKYQLPLLPTPGEAVAKLSKRLASRVKEPTEKPKKISADQLAWQAAGLHCSANERRADEASRDVEAWLKCKYMREHLGEDEWKSAQRSITNAHYTDPAIAAAMSSRAMKAVFPSAAEVYHWPDFSASGRLMNRFSWYQVSRKKR